MEASVTQLDLGGFTIELIRKNIKHVHLAVYPPHGRVRVAAPLRTSDDAVRLFAIARLPWIRRQQGKFAGQERQPPRRFIAGESHYVDGRRFRLQVISETPKRVELKRGLRLYVPAESTLEEREAVFLDWYRQRLKTQIPELLDKWSLLMDVDPPQWGVKRMKTKWGSCNIQARRIWLNLELAKKPTYCLEYVIVHELAHFTERHHNERFKLLLDQFLPSWRVYRDELNQAPLLEEESDVP